jgi:hypothetical protein
MYAIIAAPAAAMKLPEKRISQNQRKENSTANLRIGPQSRLKTEETSILLEAYDEARMLI